jgi:hypothetical protein
MGSFVDLWAQVTAKHVTQQLAEFISWKWPETERQSHLPSHVCQMT